MKLLIDMDGTCLDPHSCITDSTLEALRMAADSNILYSSHHRSGFILSASSTY